VRTSAILQAFCQSLGSYARGDHTEESDIDLLVEMPEGTSLIDFAGLKLDLEDELGKKVDLVSYDSINKRIKPYIEKDVIQIL
jgi:predicted nucleotidyltransferase